MANNIGFGVRLYGFSFEDFHFTVNLAAGITAADVGKAVAQDTGAANTVKLAGDGDPIIGRLEVVEDRVQEGIKVGTVAMKFMAKLPVKSGEVITLGSSVQGAGNGEVKALAVTDTTSAGGVIRNPSHNKANRVWQVLTGFVVVEQI